MLSENVHIANEKKTDAGFLPKNVTNAVALLNKQVVVCFSPFYGNVQI